jgi:UDP-N-acetylglucosamine--N-acetylmuramyl-(pentapeptide) pyrophosphoryl-undecaprenol N-acetylglucosamine transferase
MPNVIFSKGGPRALPVILAAQFYFIPVVIHESDTIPGYTNRISSHFARRIAISFEYANRFFSKNKVALVGNPVRKSLFLSLPSREGAKQHFGLNTEIPTLFFFGGSQGASQINDFISSNIIELLKEFQIIHAVGENNFEEFQQIIGVTLQGVPDEIRQKYFYAPYFDFVDMRFAYSAADIVVARAGSGTIFEIAGFGRASFLIPLIGSANDHQRINAIEYARTGAALVMEKENFTPHLITTNAHEIISHPERLQKMEFSARSFFRGDATAVIADELIRIGKAK